MSPAGELARSLSEVGLLAPKSGSLELGLQGRPDFLGGALEYRHRVSERLSLFAQGSGGLIKTQRFEPGWQAMAGLRFSW